jgi:hypothetical protein
MKPNLFVRKDFISHAGQSLEFKIECDALTDEDLECLAYIISKQVKFCDVEGVPSGGERLAKKLKKHGAGAFSGHQFLIVDDVLTTGGSMEKFKQKFACSTGIIGIVIFARGTCPAWVRPIFRFEL